MVRPGANSHSVSRASSASVTLPALERRCADVFICLPLLWIGIANEEERGSRPRSTLARIFQRRDSRRLATLSVRLTAHTCHSSTDDASASMYMKRAEREA